MTTPDQTTYDDRGQRPARSGERCTCGRPAAVVVYRTERSGEVQDWTGREQRQPPGPPPGFTAPAAPAGRRRG